MPSKDGIECQRTWRRRAPCGEPAKPEASEPHPTCFNSRAAATVTITAAEFFVSSGVLLGFITLVLRRRLILTGQFEYFGQAGAPFAGSAGVSPACLPSNISRINKPLSHTRRRGTTCAPTRTCLLGPPASRLHVHPGNISSINKPAFPHLQAGRLRSQYACLTRLRFDVQSRDTNRQGHERARNFRTRIVFVGHNREKRIGAVPTCRLHRPPAEEPQL